MGEADSLLTAIEAIHAAGIDETAWPVALAAMAKLIGSSGATVESYELPSGRVLELHAHGIPPAEQLDYFEHYAAINPRAAHAFRQPAGDILWDYRVLDESAMDRDPYYSELLPRTDFRYFLSGSIIRTSRLMSVATLQRTRLQGHVEAAEIALMQRLLPHLRQAVDVSSRIKGLAGVGTSLGHALDWLEDGVALVGPGGEVLHANEALQAIVRRSDGIRLVGGRLEFTSRDADTRFALVMAWVAALRDGRVDGTAASDFRVDRGGGIAPYILSVRPLMAGERLADGVAHGVAIVFVHDPLRDRSVGARLLQEVFGFTPAEADLACALQSGIPLAQYARERAVSANTVYTHLRRIKDKTGCGRLVELIGKLNELRLPVRQA